MLNGSTRICDLCACEIPEGVKYRVTIVPKRQADFFRDLLERVSGLEMTPTTTVDPAENIRMDVCLECHRSLGPIQDTGTVNQSLRKAVPWEEKCRVGLPLRGLGDL